MNTQELLAELQNQVRSGSLNKSQVLAVFDSPETGEHTSHKIINILYVIGAIIALVGVIILVSDNWDAIGFVGRIAATLGISLATYIAGFMTRSEKHLLSQVMFFVSTVLAPIGAYVYLIEGNFRITPATQIVVALILAIVYAAAYVAARKNILVLSVIGFSTWLYYSIIEQLFISNSLSVQVLQWATIAIGLAYICCAYAFSTYKMTDIALEEKSVAGILYGTGSLMVYVSVISLGGAYDAFFIAVLFAGFYGSTFAKSRMMLIFSSFFLIIHIFKLTNEYFYDSIGWPIALIFTGFVVIAVGYGTLWLNRKFIKAA